MYHKCRKLTTNTRELEWMAWDVMFYLDFTAKKGNVFPFIANIRS